METNVKVTVLIATIGKLKGVKVEDQPIVLTTNIGAIFRHQSIFRRECINSNIISEGELINLDKLRNMEIHGEINHVMKGQAIIDHRTNMPVLDSKDNVKLHNTNKLDAPGFLLYLPSLRLDIIDKITANFMSSIQL